MKGTDNDIERYRRGELTAAERHALEKRALSDPFLADALEGAGQITPEEFTSDLKALKHRIQGRRPIFTPLRIAAGVLVIIAAGWMTVYQLDEAQPELLTAGEEKPEQQGGGKDSASGGTAPRENELLSLNQEKEKVEERKNEPRRAAKKPPRPADHAGPTLAARDDDAVVSEPAEQADEITQRAEEQHQGELAQTTDTMHTQVAPQFATQRLAQSRQQASSSGLTGGERSQPASVPLSDEAKMSKKAAVAKDLASVGPSVITGKVTLADDGIALPGANVTVKGSSVGTVTDMHGNYSLVVPGPAPTLLFSFIGLQTQEATPAGGPTLDVKLKEDASQLSEVVVTGYASNAVSEPVIILAEPAGGKRAYDKYLESNLRYPQLAAENNIKGRVSIQFTVGANGVLRDFKVLKSLGFGCDEEVIRLVKEGPAWVPSSENNVPTESSVRLRMRFDPSKRR